ncbi:hypothetical protein NE237_010100 [Protea cynaroides]|uniref:Uncharacterized protein n=1 Tax=Protea cynaroides TaxID=273540 RepID=A0A9Q0R1C6_9MAGN|nr:hypothetical protein NE237_010100 [Protea cynaroides]
MSIQTIDWEVSASNKLHNDTSLLEFDLLSAGGDTVFLTTIDEESNSNVHRWTNIPSVDTPKEIPFKEIIAATNDFSESHRVAGLDFGTAYHGFLENRRHVLVKRLWDGEINALH